eukprot:5103132-Amphidinium_carterae.3
MLSVLPSVELVMRLADRTSTCVGWISQASIGEAVVTHISRERTRCCVLWHVPRACVRSGLEKDIAQTRALSRRCAN